MLAGSLDGLEARALCFNWQPLQGAGRPSWQEDRAGRPRRFEFFGPMRGLRAGIANPLGLMKMNVGFTDERSPSFLFFWLGGSVGRSRYSSPTLERPCCGRGKLVSVQVCFSSRTFLLPPRIPQRGSPQKIEQTGPVQRHKRRRHFLRTALIVVTRRAFCMVSPPVFINPSPELLDQD